MTTTPKIPAEMLTQPDVSCQNLPARKAWKFTWLTTDNRWETKEREFRRSISPSLVFWTKDWLANKRTLLLFSVSFSHFVYAKMRRKGTARRQTRYDVDDDLSGTVSFFSFRISTPDQRFIRLTFRLNQLKQRQTVTYRNVSNEKLSLLPLGFPCGDCAEKRCVCVCVCVSGVKKRNTCKHLISYLPRHLYRRR